MQGSTSPPLMCSRTAARPGPGARRDRTCLSPTPWRVDHRQLLSRLRHRRPRVRASHQRQCDLRDRRGQRESIGAHAKTATVYHTLQHPHELFRVQVAPAIRWSKSAMVHLEDIRIDVRRNNNLLGSYILKPTSQEPPCPTP